MIKKFLSKYRWLRQIYISLLNLLDYVINLFKIIFSPINEIKFLRWIFFLALPRSRYFQIDIQEIKFFVNSSDKVISKKIFVSKKFPEFQLGIKPQPTMEVHHKLWTFQNIARLSKI